MWPEFHQSNVNMANSDEEAPKVKSFPWDKKRKAERAAAKKAEAEAKKAEADAKKAEADAKKAEIEKKKAEAAAKKKPLTSEAKGKPPVGDAKEKSPALDAKRKPHAGDTMGRPLSASGVPKRNLGKQLTPANIQEKVAALPYPVISHYKMPIPGQFSYPYQLPISGQPIVLPGRHTSNFCRHCGRGDDRKAHRKGKKKDDALDMDTFLADVERKLTGKLQMQELFMHELEEHYRDTLVTRSPPPCRRSHTDEDKYTEDDDAEEQSHMSPPDQDLQHLHPQKKNEHPQRHPQHHTHHHHHHHAQHSHQHKKENQSKRQQEDHETKPHQDTGRNHRCARNDSNLPHPNRHPRPCPKANESEQFYSSPRCWRDRNDRANEKRISSQRMSGKKQNYYEKFAHKSNRKSASSNDTSSLASYRKPVSFEDSAISTKSVKSNTPQRNKSDRSHNKALSARNSENGHSKFRSQLEIVTSQLPFRERKALKKSLVSLRARKEDKELERQLSLLERELFAGDENVEWEQQLSLDTPSGRMKMDEVEAKEDDVLDALFKEQDGFSEDDILSEPEPI